MGIMGDILDVTADGGRGGVIVSAISRKANLSHYAVLDKCEKLVEAGLVESVKNDRNRVFLITEKGRGIRFKENDVRVMGRTAAGVRTIRLSAEDNIAVAEVIEPGGLLFLVTQNGYGRCTPLDAFRVQKRGGKGVRAYSGLEITGPVADGRVVQPEDELTLISEGGILIRTQVNLIPAMGRYSRGVHMMDLKEGDSVASIARLLNSGEEEEVEDETDDE